MKRGMVMSNCDKCGKFVKFKHLKKISSGFYCMDCYIGIRKENRKNIKRIFLNTHDYNRREINFLKKNYLNMGNKELAKNLGKSYGSIVFNLRKYDLQRDKESLHEILHKNKVGKNNPAFGKKLSDEHKRKLTFKGKIHTDKSRRKNREKHIGKKNCNWKGGLSFEPYPKEFDENFKLLIKQRDGFMCLKCGMREEDSIILFKIKLHIHHINYQKTMNIPENCCSLCIRCNSEVNSNRPHWTKFFQSLLSERYGYKYSENGEIILEVKNEI